MSLMLSSTVDAFRAYVFTSAAAQVFGFSACVLFFGVGLEVWLKAVRLSDFDELDLREVELRHPHLPSLRVIAGAFLCSAALLAVSLLSFHGTPLLRGPYESIYLLAVFALAAAVGTLAELRWRGAKEHLSAFVTGTALAFLALAVAAGAGPNASGRVIPQFVILVVCVALAERLLYRPSSRAARAVLLATCAAWLTVGFTL
jgi:hypothetical protein